jgi:hypothetical protein
MRLRVMAAVVLGLVWSSAAAPALAAGPSVGFLRIAYFSPDGPGVDVYVDSARVLSGMAYKTVSPYQRLDAGSHTVDVRQAGAGAGTAPLVSRSVTVGAGSYQTVAAAGKVAQLVAVPFDDGFSAPALGRAQVRAMHFAPEVPAVDIAVRNGPVIFTGVAFPNATSYTSVTGGAYDLEFRAAGTDQVLLTASGITVKPGMVESLAGVGGVGRPIEVVQIPDAAAAAAVGGARTGMGGMAGPALPGGGLAEALVAMALAAAAVLAVRRRPA